MATLKRYNNVSETMLKAIFADVLARSIIHPSVQQLAAEIIADSSEPVIAVYDWMKQNVAYVNDPVDAESIIAPWVMVEMYRNGEKLGGDCDDQATWVAALLGAAGYDTKIVLLGQLSAEFDHAIASVMVPGIYRDTWVDVDTTSGMQPTWWQNVVRRVEIGPSR